MKFSRPLMLWVALLPLVPAARAQNESLASMFTNSAAAHASRVGVPRRASIILITCQGLAPGDLGCYGQTRIQTPNLDRLAAEGVRFANYRAGGDGLPAAQAALLAGGLASIPNRTDTLAESLRHAGYRTGLIGEWTLGPQPADQGFDDFAGFLNEQEAYDYYSDFIWRTAPRSLSDPPDRTQNAKCIREQIYKNLGGHKGAFMPDFLMDVVNNFIRVNVPDFANHYRPFFLMVNLPVPHSVTPGRDVYPVPTDAPYNGEAWPQAAKNRAALVTRLDSSIGRLFEQLKKFDMTNNVAIFFTGASAPEKFADTNLDFLDLSGETRGGTSPDHLRVPMIVRWPGHVPAGRTLQTPAAAADFAATALDIAGAQPAANAAGGSLLPALLGQTGAGAPGQPPAP